MYKFKKQPKLYTAEAVENTINNILIPGGYEIQTIPGALIDTFICLAPSPAYYNYIFKETYLNEWSSAYTMRRCQSLPAWVLRELDRIGSATA